jgi:RHS repeat-associated protein
VLAEVGSTATKLYVRTPDGRLIAGAHHINENTYFDNYYHFDALGSTKALTGWTGEVADRYSYDVWGNVTRDTGDSQQPYMFVGQLGYYTNYQDEMLSPFSSNSGKHVLLQLGVRYYDPSVGRFSQRDIIHSDKWSLYAYCENSPSAWRDPSGKFLWIPIMIEIGGAAAAVDSMIIGRCLAKETGVASDIMDKYYKDAYRKRMKPTPGCDLLAHCYMGCQSVRCAQHIRCVARRLITLMDANHNVGDADYNLHKRYNHAGYGIGWTGQSCIQACTDYWKRDNYGIHKR